MPDCRHPSLIIVRLALACPGCDDFMAEPFIVFAPGSGVSGGAVK
jgi:hypothetical protein